MQANGEVTPRATAPCVEQTSDEEDVDRSFSPPGLQSPMLGRIRNACERIRPHSAELAASGEFFGFFKNAIVRSLKYAQVRITQCNETTPSDLSVADIAEALTDCEENLQYLTELSPQHYGLPEWRKTLEKLKHQFIQVITSRL